MKLSRITTATWVFVLMAALLLPATGSARAGQAMKKRKEKSLLEVRKHTYEITQQDRVMGQEAVTISRYDNNTIHYDATLGMQVVDQVRFDQTMEMDIREDTHFPLHYKMEKKVTQPQGPFTHYTEITFYSNVADVITGVQDKSNEYRFVVPTGSSLIETGVAHQCELLLFWYDRKMGGRQRVFLFDLVSQKPENANLRVIGEETITIGDKQYDTFVYELERQRMSVTLYADASDRLVRFEQGPLTYNLVESSSESIGGE